MIYTSQDRIDKLVEALQEAKIQLDISINCKTHGTACSRAQVARSIITDVLKELNYAN
tara:strand:- start:22413 stop:22586 length:174 start_codon:yes stop_codon:yes gene_type:complete